MATHRGVQHVVQYGIQTSHSKTILMVTENLAEAERMLDMVGEGRLIARTIRYGPWKVVETEMPIPS